ncbi:MAG: chemotaxis protein CheW [Panacagrimonas sp.]
MSTTGGTLHAVLIQIARDALLLPNAAVAEVSVLDRFKPAHDGPEWLVGWHTAAERRIPVISFESLSGQPRPETNKRARIVIVNALGRRGQAGAYALLAQGHPHLMSLDRAAIRSVGLRPGDRDDLVLSRVGVEQQGAIIPDLEEIEARVAKLV